jgi:hypothetical protein
VASDPSLPLQAALISALRVLGTAAGSNVFDRVPEGDPFPRITLGAWQSIPDDADCYDGTESFVQVDVWSRAVGYPEVKSIAGAVRDRLHDGDLVVGGHSVELMTVESVDYLRDPDGLTSRARISLRILSQSST